MAFAQVTFQAQRLGKQSSLNVILPESPGPWAVLYLLHGLSDDHTCWMRYTSIERYVRTRENLMVVMPDGHRSFYVNDPEPGGCAYEDHIVEDVVHFVDRTFPTVADRKGRAIAGLSMGGYGATMLAMKHPGMFSVASSHSGAVSYVHNHPHRQGTTLHPLLTRLDRRQYSCLELAARLKGSPHRLAYRFDCGLDDFLLEANRTFAAHLDKIGLQHAYFEYPGGHDWQYWDEHIQDTLAFLDENLQALPSQSSQRPDRD
jgi:S-formylglutathione hydrolase FrmB